MIDPIVVRLLDQKGRYDLSMQQHLFESLHSLMEFGGSMLGKACQETEVAKSMHPSLSSGSGRYTALLVDVVIA